MGLQTIRTANFIDSIGINTHMDFTWTAYKNLQVVTNSINYLGIKNLRDSPNSPFDVGANGLWQKVADATGAKFDAFMATGSYSNMQYNLSLIPQLAKQGILNFIEGANEPDAPYAIGLGNSLSLSASFQKQVYDVGHKFDLPVINMSFGQGWDKSANGNYGAVGDLSKYTDYANAHTYFGTGNPPGYTIKFINSLAKISSDKPVITTEIGWYTTKNMNDPHNVSETAQAKYMLDALFDSMKAGNVKTYLYELLDQGTGSGNTEYNFGLFHSDGSAKLAATALHNLTTLLQDKGANAGSFTASSLSYTLTGMKGSDDSLLMQKSDGTHWLAIWNESRISSATSAADVVVPDHNITFNLNASTANLKLYDPLSGTAALKIASNAGSLQISLPDHPILVQIDGLKATQAIAPVAAGAPAAVAVGLTYKDLSVTGPGSQTVALDGEAPIVGLDIFNAWAKTFPGQMALNISVNRGAISMEDAKGNALAGSGTGNIHFKGSLDQLNKALDTLDYQAPSSGGSAIIKINPWNQAGVNTTKTVTINTLDLSGNDILRGTSGNDVMSGGKGKDAFTGGLGSDIFNFAKNDMGKGSAADRITDFSQTEGDKINLHELGLDAFDFVGKGAFSGNGGSFGYATGMDGNTPYTLVRLDTDGDRVTDYEIRLDNAQLTLQESDFTFM